MKCRIVHRSSNETRIIIHGWSYFYYTTHDSDSVNLDHCSGGLWVVTTLWRGHYLTVISAPNLSDHFTRHSLTQTSSIASLVSQTPMAGSQTVKSPGRLQDSKIVSCLARRMDQQFGSSLKTENIESHENIFSHWMKWCQFLCYGSGWTVLYSWFQGWEPQLQH